MPQLSLSTFAKITQLSAERKVSEYSRYLTPGGFDYYRELREAIAIATWKKGKIDDALDLIGGIGDPSRRKNSRNAFASFAKSYIIPGIDFYIPPQGEIVSPGGFIKVQIRPAALISQGDECKLVAIWPNSTVKLQTRGASVIVDLMSKHLVTELPIATYIVADLTEGKPIIATKTSLAASAMVAGELAFADAFFAAGEAMEKDEKAA
jgi:hypothetical protein